MDNTIVSQPSTVVNESYQMINIDQAKFPTWSLIIVLIITFFILKTFIYIKDGERDGK